VDLDVSGRRWRQKPLAERLQPAWVHVLMTAVSVTFGVRAWVGIGDETPLERSRVVAVALWLVAPGLDFAGCIDAVASARRDGAPSRPC